MQARGLYPAAVALLPDNLDSSQCLRCRSWDCTGGRRGGAVVQAVVEAPGRGKPGVLVGRRAAERGSRAVVDRRAVERGSRTAVDRKAVERGSRTAGGWWPDRWARPAGTGCRRRNPFRQRRGAGIPCRVGAPRSGSLSRPLGWGAGSLCTPWVPGRLNLKLGSHTTAAWIEPPNEIQAI